MVHPEHLEKSKTRHLRFEYLDGLRGIAALLVVFWHFRQLFVSNILNTNLFTKFWNLFDVFFLTGTFAVQLFFVLSGFVLSYGALNSKSFIYKQLTKRAFRLIFPVFITSVIYYFFLRKGLIVYNSDYAEAYIKGIGIDNFLLWNTIFNFKTFIVLFFRDFLLFGDWSFNLNINSALWTIPIELYWSYVILLTQLLITKISNKGIKVATLTICMLFGAFFAAFKGFEFGILFLSGSLFAFFHKNLCTISFNWLVKIGLLIIVIIVSFFARFWLSNVFAILLLGGALHITILREFLSSKIFVFLGKISFSLYLLHMLPLGSIVAWLFLKYQFFQADVGLLILSIFFVFIASILAYIFTIFIDEPSMKIFDKMYNTLHKVVSQKR
ncbi:MAG: hypothetical protein RIR12_1411 [Bacteroidota bacterium]